MRGRRGRYRFRQLVSSPGRTRKGTNWTPSSGGTFRATNGNTESATRGNPPVPAAEPSLRKASREPITKVADAINAIHRVLRPGRYATLRIPKVDVPRTGANLFVCSQADSSSNAAISNRAPLRSEE